MSHLVQRTNLPDNKDSFKLLPLIEGVKPILLRETYQSKYIGHHHEKSGCSTKNIHSMSYVPDLIPQKQHVFFANGSVLI